MVTKVGVRRSNAGGRTNEACLKLLRASRSRAAWQADDLTAADAVDHLLSLMREDAKWSFGLGRSIDLAACFELAQRGQCRKCLQKPDRYGREVPGHHRNAHGDHDASGQHAEDASCFPQRSRALHETGEKHRCENEG